MSALGRRLSALEEIAAQLERQEMRALILSLPEARDLTPAEIEEAVTEARRFLIWLRTLRSDGLSERQVWQRVADVEGLPVEQVEAAVARQPPHSTGITPRRADTVI